MPRRVLDSVFKGKITVGDRTGTLDRGVGQKYTLSQWEGSHGKCIGVYSKRDEIQHFEWEKCQAPYVEPDDQVLSAPILGSTIAMDNHWPNNPAKRRTK